QSSPFHQLWGEWGALVNGIVNYDARHQDRPENRRFCPERKDHQPTDHNEGPSYCPYRSRANLFRWNWPLGAIAPVEPRIKGVVQKHAGSVQETGAGTEDGEPLPAATAGEKPRNEAVGPDRRQVRD